MIEKSYAEWCQNATADPELAAELAAMKDAPEKIEDAFFADLAFGTGGLRGKLGAGTRRMNLYTVARATAGLADINRIFEEKTGEKLTNAARPYVEAYDHGGKTAGMVSGKWWLMTGIPILVNLREVAEANMEEFDTILRDGTAGFAYRTHECKPA